MKKIFLIVTIFLSSITFAQEFKQEGDILSFFEIVEIPGKTKADIYKGIKLFLNDTNQKSKQFIDVDDPESGIISYSTGTPNYELSDLFYFKTKYKATIDIKDGKFKYSIAKIDFIQIVTKLNMELNTTYQSVLEEAESKKEFERLNKELTETKRDKRKDQIIDTINKKTKNVEEVKNKIEKTKNIISSQPQLIKEFILKNTW